MSMCTCLCGDQRATFRSWLSLSMLFLPHAVSSRLAGLQVPWWFSGDYRVQPPYSSSQESSRDWTQIVRFVQPASLFTHLADPIFSFESLWIDVVFASTLFPSVRILRCRCWDVLEGTKDLLWNNTCVKKCDRVGLAGRSHRTMTHLKTTPACGAPSERRFPSKGRPQLAELAQLLGLSLVRTLEATQRKWSWK